MQVLTGTDGMKEVPTRISYVSDKDLELDEVHMLCNAVTCHRRASSIDSLRR